MNNRIDTAWHACATALVATTLVACGGGGTGDAGANPDPTTPPAAKSFRAAGLVYGAPSVLSDAAGGQVLTVPLLTAKGVEFLSTGSLSADAAAAIQASLAPGNLVDWLPRDNGRIAVTEDAAQTFNVVLRKGTSANAQFNLQKYGAAVTRHEDTPGPMVAAGWVYGKTDTTLTVGDGSSVTTDQSGRPYEQAIRRYQETYTVSPDVQVFNVDTSDYTKSRVSTFADIPVTASYDYATTSRQAVYVLFDDNYENAAHAKVTAIWYFTPQSTSDGKPVWEVPSQSPMLNDKGADPVGPALCQHQRHLTDQRSLHPQHRTLRDHQEHDVLRGRQRSGLLCPESRHGDTRRPVRRQDHQDRRRLAQQRLSVLAQPGADGHRPSLGHRPVAHARPRRPLRNSGRAAQDDGQRGQAIGAMGIQGRRAGRDLGPAGQCLEHHRRAPGVGDRHPRAHLELLLL